MKAMLLEQDGDVTTNPLRMRDLSLPEPAPGQVRVKVTICGVCRTDLHVVEGELPPSTRPIVPGHETVGIVDQVGPGVTLFKEGDRVGIAWLQATCRTCEFCQTGRENLCAQATFTGYHVNGGYAEYALVSERFAYPIPDIFSDEEAAPLLCAGIIGYRALRRSRVQPGQRLGLYGFGASAHITSRFKLLGIGVVRSMSVRFGKNIETWLGNWERPGLEKPLTCHPQPSIRPSCLLQRVNSFHRRCVL
jgi:propanol-preferring alcohol dehydrogenase